MLPEETKTWRDQKVNPRHLAEGDLILIRKHNAKMAGKLRPKWTGPYLITKSVRPGSFHLQDGEGNTLPHAWNIDD